MEKYHLVLKYYFKNAFGIFFPCKGELIFNTIYLLPVVSECLSHSLCTALLG